MLLRAVDAGPRWLAHVSDAPESEANGQGWCDRPPDVHAKYLITIRVFPCWGIRLGSAVLYVCTYSACSV